MDFSISKKEILFRQMLREFTEKEVKPLAAEVDELERFPTETVEKMGRLGSIGSYVVMRFAHLRIWNFRTERTISSQLSKW